MGNPIERQINEDPNFAFIDRFTRKSEMIALPMRLEPSGSYSRYMDEEIELSPTVLLELEEEREGNIKPFPYILRLGGVTKVESYPFQYKGPEGTLQKKIHYQEYLEGYEQGMLRAFFTLEPPKEEGMESQPYLRIMHEPERGDVTYSFGLKNEWDILAWARFNKHGNLAAVGCQTGETLPNPNLKPGVIQFQTGPYQIAFYDINASKWLKNGGKAKPDFEYRSFGEIITGQSLGITNGDNTPVNDGKGARIRRVGDYLRMETGLATDLDHPIFSMDLPLKINAREVKSLLVSRDTGSLIELLERTQVAFESKQHNVRINTLPPNFTSKNNSR